jgi:hypothetical protein
MATGGNSDPRQFEWMATLGGMVKHRTVVKASCRTCGAIKHANVNTLLAHLGADGSLLDRHPPCWVRTCPGEVVFLASPRDRSTPFRPCITVKGQVARLKRQRDERDRIKALRNG